MPAFIVTSKRTGRVWIVTADGEGEARSKVARSCADEESRDDLDAVFGSSVIELEPRVFTKPYR